MSSRLDTVTACGATIRPLLGSVANFVIRCSTSPPLCTASAASSRPSDGAPQRNVNIQRRQRFGLGIKNLRRSCGASRHRISEQYVCGRASLALALAWTPLCCRGRLLCQRELDSISRRKIGHCLIGATWTPDTAKQLVTEIRKISDAPITPTSPFRMDGSAAFI